MIIVRDGKPPLFHHTNPEAEGTPDFEHVTEIDLNSVTELLGEDQDNRYNPLSVLCGLCGAQATVPLNGDRTAQTFHALYRANKNNISIGEALDSVASDVTDMRGDVRVGW